MMRLTHVLLDLQITFPISEGVRPTLLYRIGQMLKFNQKINPMIVSMKK